MSKIVLTDTAGGFNIAVINDNFDQLESTLQNKVLYRDNPAGEPNNMESDLDMDGNRIFNLPAPVAMSEAARLQDVVNSIAGIVPASAIPFTPYQDIIATNVQQAIEQVRDNITEHTEVNVRDYMSPAQKADADAYTYLLDCTPAFQSAINALVALRGGKLRVPRGGYRLNGGVASPDGFKNGILLPDTNGNFTTRNGIKIVGDGVDTVLRAGSTNMIILRHSRLYSGGESFRLDGNSLAGVWGRAIVPEDMTQITELVSHSYAIYRDVYLENCIEATVLMPGPTVLGSDSGCFYHRFYNDTNNNNLRDYWLKKDITGANNRTTRSTWYSPIFTRGNTGMEIDGGTELTLVDPQFEMKSFGTVPNAVPTAFKYNDTNPANIRIIGGYAEACTRALESTVAAAPQISIFGFGHNSTRHSSEFLMGRYMTGRLTVPKLTNVAGYINVGGESFAGFTVDPDQTGAKVIECSTNAIPRWRSDATGMFSHFGSIGNITFAASGANISFTRDGSSSISATGASATLNFQSNTLNFQSGTAVLMSSMTTARLAPGTDNTWDVGTAALRVANTYTRQVRPGAGAVIWTSGAGSPETVVTAPVGSLYTRTDGGAATTLYVKETGVGNTGWVGK